MLRITRARILWIALGLGCSFLPLESQAAPHSRNYAFTLFAGYPFGSSQQASLVPAALNPPVQFTIGAAMERHLVSLLSLQLSVAESKVDPPFGWFGTYPNSPTQQPAPNGASLFSADLTAMVSIRHRGPIQPYLIAGPGLAIIHIPGANNTEESNSTLGGVFGAGLKIHLPHHWQLRPELRLMVHASHGDQPMVGYNRFTLGISHTF